MPSLIAHFIDFKHQKFLNHFFLFFLIDISQRKQRDRYLNYYQNELIVTSAPLIANSVWLNDILKNQLINNPKRRKLKRELNTNQAIFFRKKSEISDPQNKSKYQKLNQDKNRVFNRLRRELIEDDLISKNKSNLNCDYQVLQCVLFDSKGYVIYSAVGSFFIPMLIMIFFYWRIYLVASYTTKALNRGYISKKSIRSNPLSMLTGSKNEISTSILQKSNANSTQFNNLDSNSDMMSSNLTLRVHRGYIKDQPQPAQLNLANDLNRKSTNRSSYDSTGRQSSTSTTVTVRANSTVDTTTAAQLCRRLLPTRLSNRILSNNDAKQLRKIQHRSVRCLDRTQNIITLAADASKPKAAPLKRTQSEQFIELSSNKSADDLNKNLDKSDKDIEKSADKRNGKDNLENKEKDKIADKMMKDKLNDKEDIKNTKNENTIRVSNSEKNIASKLQLVKQYSLSSSNLLNSKNQRKFTFNLKKDANLQKNASQIQLNIEPPQEDRIINGIKSSENDHLIPKVGENDNLSNQQNGYQNEINNNLPKNDLIEHLDSSNQLGNNLANQQTNYLTTSGSTKSKYLSYWSRLSKKRTNLNKNPNQNTNSSGKFQAKRFLAETKGKMSLIIYKSLVK